MLHDFDFVAGGDFQPLHQVFGGNPGFDPVAAAVESALMPPGQVQRRFTQGFTGNGSGVQAGATDGAVLFHQCNAVTELGGLDGPLLASRPAADYHEIIVLHATSLRWLGALVFCRPEASSFSSFEPQYLFKQQRALVKDIACLR